MYDGDDYDVIVPDEGKVDDQDVEIEERVVVEEQLVDNEEDAEYYAAHGPRDHFNPHDRDQLKEALAAQRGEGAGKAGAQIAHAQHPIFLVEKILRSKVFDSTYYKTHCFGLTAETIIDKVIETINAVGGHYGGNRKPTPFVCLLVRMLEIQVERDIAIEYVKQEHYKYLTALGAFYLRMTADAQTVYEVLEPLLEDFRKLRMRQSDGSWKIIHVDEFIETLLNDDMACELQLPFIAKRRVLEQRGTLPPRKSFFDEMDDEEVEEMLHELEREEQEQIQRKIEELKKLQAKEQQQAPAPPQESTQQKDETSVASPSSSSRRDDMEEDQQRKSSPSRGKKRSRDEYESSGDERDERDYDGGARSSRASPPRYHDDRDREYDDRSRSKSSGNKLRFKGDDRDSYSSRRDSRDRDRYRDERDSYDKRDYRDDYRDEYDSRNSSRRRDDDRHRDSKDRRRDDRDRRRSSGSGGSGSSKDVSMSIEETNALRAKLGLAPLK